MDIFHFKSYLKTKLISFMLKKIKKDFFTINDSISDLLADSWFLKYSLDIIIIYLLFYLCTNHKIQ